MKRVTGLGGVFFRCNNPGKMKEWYGKHLGIKAGKNGAMFAWRNIADYTKTCYTVRSPFLATTSYFSPSDKPFMFNYRVENLMALLEALKKEGIQIVGEVEEYAYGKFGWIMDPEGNKIESLEPIDDKLTPHQDGRL